MSGFVSGCWGGVLYACLPNTFLIGSPPLPWTQNLLIQHHLLQEACYHHTPRPFPQPYGTAFVSSLTLMKREVVSFCSKFYISIWSTNFIKKLWQPAYNDFRFFSAFPWDEVLGETGEKK